MVMHSTKGYAIPFFLRDIRSQAITSAFTPTTEEYIKHGFLVMPAEDLTLEVITWNAYDRNSKTVVGLTPVSVFCSAGQWLACPIVQVGAEAGKTVNIGVI
jgi:hypothetical protein